MPKYIIIGAGAAGLFSARALMKAGIPTTDIIILEKESRIGGKCCTYYDEKSGFIAEYGATLVAHNYGVVLDAIFEKKIALKRPLPTDLDSIAFVKQFKNKTILKKGMFIVSFMKEMLCFLYLTHCYQRIKNKGRPLPKLFTDSFFEFAQLKKLLLLNEFLRPFVTGFGYGAMQTCPTFSVMEYMGYTTLLGAIPALFGRGMYYAIAGGFETLITAIAEDFHIIKDVTITEIQRTDGIRVTYTQTGHTHELLGSYLILALPPNQWPSLGITSWSATEKACYEAIRYTCYPVAICNIDSHPAKHAFFEDALQPEGFGALALITTHDPRAHPEEGRLCTAYVNLPEGPAPDTKDIFIAVEAKLKKLNHITSVTWLEQHIWEDYMSHLPWANRCALESKQFDSETRTGYVNACLSFEDIACIATQAKELIEHHLNKRSKQSFWRSWIRLMRTKLQKSPFTVIRRT